MAIWKQPTTYVLCILLCVGTFLRFDRIAKESLWVDEYWALYLATGRGNQIFDIPLNTVIRSPPAANFTDAPHWSHIWTGLGSVLHPPLYLLMLRGWVDLFGDSDLATRGMSAVFGLAAILLIFDLARSLHGKLAGIFAAGVMTFAPIQIDFSQQDRPYTLLAFLALLLWRSLILIEQKGLTRIRLLAFALAVTGLALTHYFSLGVIAAAALYVVLRFRGHQRKSILLALIASLLFIAVIWAPFAWETRHQYIVGPNFGKMGVGLGSAAIDAPRKLLAGDLTDPVGKIVLAWTLAFLVYLSPAFRIRNDPKLLPAWLWAIGGLGSIIAIDCLGHTQFVFIPRYIFISAPAVYLILAAPWGSGIGRLLPPVLLLATLLFGIDRWQSGPPIVESIARLAPLIEEKVGGHDAVIITGQFPTEPAFRYFAISHYTGDWRHPVIFLTQPLDRTVDQNLSTFDKVWIVGHDPTDTDKFLPGWRATEFHGIRPGLCFWGIVRAK